MARVPQKSNWLKAADLQKGDTVKILTEADWEETSFKGETRNQFVCQVEYKGEEKKLKLTMASCSEISPIYGDDTKEWIGKTLELESVKIMVGGEIKYSILATAVGATPEVKTETVWDEGA